MPIVLVVIGHFWCSHTVDLQVTQVDIIQADLVSPLLERLQHAVDILVSPFLPPLPPPFLKPTQPCLTLPLHNHPAISSSAVHRLQQRNRSE